MALTPIKYQSLNWRTTEAVSSECGHCKNEVYMDWTTPIVQAIETSEYNGYNLINYTYNGDITTPIPTTRTPTLVRLADGSPEDYCYDRTTGDPYWGSYTVDLARRSASIGDIALNDYLKVEFTYTSNVVLYCTIHIQRSTGQSASTPVYIELPVNLTGGTVTEYILVASNVSAYKLFIKFNSSTVDEDAEFCFSDLSLKNMTTLISNSVHYIDCYGDEETIAHDFEYYRDRILLTMEMYEDEQMGYFRLQGGINPSEATSFDSRPKLYTNWVIMLNPETYGACKLNSLIKVEWTTTCMYVSGGEQQSIDYSFYLQGFAKPIGWELGERLLRTTETGDTQNVFDYSRGKAEIVTGVYSWWVHEIMKSASSSNTFFVNDQQYKPDASNIYTPVPLNNGYFTGRVEMTIGDSHRVISLCCCPVQENDYSVCGTFTITSICLLNTVVLGTPIQVIQIYYELDGAVNATSIDVQFENLEAIDSSPCTVAANTTHIESSVDLIGNGYVQFSSGDWQTVFDDEYCEQTDIQYYIRLRGRCSDSIVGDWSDPLTIVPDNLQEC